MANPPTEHEKLIQDIDRMLAEAPDAASRADIQRLKDRLNSPEIRELAREREKQPPRKEQNLALEFHDPLLPMPVTAGASVVATAICLFAVLHGFEDPVVSIAGHAFNLWIVAAIAGALSVMFTALSFTRSFSVRVDTTGMASRISGTRWQGLKVGAMRWTEIRSLRKHADRGVLEVSAAGGQVFEIPMRIANFQVLETHLENMVRLYGDRVA
jgi:hypothetical protein